MHTGETSEMRSNSRMLALVTVMFWLPLLSAKESIVLPFAPSIVDLPKLKVVQLNMPDYKIDCALIIPNIPLVTYNWYFSPTKDGLGRMLKNRNDGSYEVRGSVLTLESNWEKRSNISGYYWCSAQNEYGQSTSSRTEVVEPRQRKRNEEISRKQVAYGESTKISFGFPPLQDNDLPVEISFSITEANQITPRLLKKEDRNFKDGRFVIGSNSDLYILQPVPMDACTIEQKFREYATEVDFPYKTVEFSVGNQPLDNPSFGFFKDMASIYLFVRGQESFFTCIPREKRTVHIKKDGVPLLLPRMEDNYVNKQPIYRTDYTVYFDSPVEQDSGKYTCQYGTNTVDYTVKVIGPPEITCKHDDLIIRSPEEDVFISCELSSEFMELERPKVYVNGTVEDLSQIGRFRIEVRKMANSDKYKVEITGNNLQQYDSTVFRIEISAAEMSKTQVLQKQNLLRDSQMNKVFFNDYRALPFTSRREVILSVLSRKPQIIDPSSGCSVLVGTKNQEIKFTIFGSPVPTVRWYQDNEEIFAGDDFIMKKSNDLYFSLIIKEVKKSSYFMVGAKNILSDGDSETQLYNLIAHEPLEPMPSYDQIFTVLNKPVTITCRTRQRNNARTMDIDFLWYLDEQHVMATSSNGFKIETAFDESTGYEVSNFTFRPIRTLQTAKCSASLGRLDNKSYTVEVLSGNAPDPPMNLKFDGVKFEWMSHRQKLFVTDILEWVPYFAESDRSSDEDYKIYEETKAHTAIVELTSEGFNDLVSKLTTDESGTMIKVATSEDTVFYKPGGNDGPFMAVSLPKSKKPENQFSPGVDYGFRVRTINQYGPSDYSVPITFRTDDAPPTKMIESLTVQPDKNDPSKIFVSWDKYPRDQYNSYNPKDCCIKLLIKAPGKADMKLDCIDPDKVGITTGWSDLDPYTEHRVEAWFSNKQGEVQDRSSTRGFNSAAEPVSYPAMLPHQGQSEPRQITVKFKSMSQKDINGKFLFYKLEVIDPETELLTGQDMDADLGVEGSEKELTVTGLLPYTNYSLVLSVHNTEHSASSPPWTQMTAAAQPQIIPTDDIIIHQSPDSVHAFWLPPSRFNGEFVSYDTVTRGERARDYPMGSVIPTVDLTPFFFPSKNNHLPFNSVYRFEVRTRNSLYLSEASSVPFTFENLNMKGPKKPEAPEVECISPAFNLTIRWTFKQYGKYASSHYIKYRASGAGEEENKKNKFESLCFTIPVDALQEQQTCVMPVEKRASSYDIHLVARNKFGEAMSQPVHCTATAPEKQVEGVVTAANVPLFIALFALVLLLVIAVLGVFYWRKNRSHPYRVREQENKYRPKDAETWPRKDDTDRFEEYHPDFFGKHPMWDTCPRTPLMPNTPRPGGSRMTLDDNSFDDDEEMLDGFNEDGSFLDAYGRAAMEPPTDLNTSV